MKTVLFVGTLALGLAMPIGAQTLDYATLCGATEGTGDNNDFCTLWAQRNYQGMRHALGISIRTARAQENRNRYYFDHKRGAERGSFIQLKRPWMGDDWQVRQTYDFNVRQIPGNSDSTITDTRETTITIYNSRLCDVWCVQVSLVDDPVAHASEDQGYEAGFQRVQFRSENDEVWGWYATGPARLEEGEEGNNYAFLRGLRPAGNTFVSDVVRLIVECAIDRYGWEVGEVDAPPEGC